MDSTKTPKPMSHDRLDDARAVANSWTAEWMRGSTYEATGDEPEWDTTDIARALYEVLSDRDYQCVRAEQAERERDSLKAELDRTRTVLRGLRGQLLTLGRLS